MQKSEVASSEGNISNPEVDLSHLHQKEVLFSLGVKYEFLMEG
jgi:hypothetical protein